MTKEDILKGESATPEFKEQLPSNSERYTKTVVAFANSKGGKIVIGVNDKTIEIKGVETASLFRTMDTIADTISQVTEPMIIPDIYPCTVEGKTLIVISVPPLMKRPYCLRKLGRDNGTYVRVGATTQPAWPEKIRELELEGTRTSWDELPAVEYRVSDEAISGLCSDINRYREAYAREKGIEAGLKEVTVRNLENWNVLKKNGAGYIASNAFALLTGDFFRYARIQCAVFAGKNRGIFIDRKEYDGPVYKQIEEAYHFVLRNIRLSSEVIGLVRHDYYEFPLRVIREMIINAVCHRNYLENGCIQVALFEDRLEVTSPGGLYMGLTLDEALSGTSRQRNKVLAEVFSEMKLIEGWGSGLSHIVHDTAEYGLKPPEFLESANMFRISIYRKDISASSGNRSVYSDDCIGVKSENQDNSVGETSRNLEIPNARDDINRTQSLILLFISENRYVTISELSSKLGISTRSIERNIQILKRKGILSRMGADKGGWWAITSSSPCTPSETSLSRK
ncbi:MAG: ATP-binding protein [Bullifex sp.]